MVDYLLLPYRPSRRISEELGYSKLSTLTHLRLRLCLRRSVRPFGRRWRSPIDAAVVLVRSVAHRG